MAFFLASDKLVIAQETALLVRQPCCTRFPLVYLDQIRWLPICRIGMETCCWRPTVLQPPPPDPWNSPSTEIQRDLLSLTASPKVICPTGFLIAAHLNKNPQSSALVHRHLGFFFLPDDDHLILCGTCLAAIPAPKPLPSPQQLARRPP